MIVTQVKIQLCLLGWKFYSSLFVINFFLNGEKSDTNAFSVFITGHGGPYNM